MCQKSGEAEYKGRQFFGFWGTWSGNSRGEPLRPDSPYPSDPCHMTLSRVGFLMLAPGKVGPQFSDWCPPERGRGRTEPQRRWRLGGAEVGIPLHSQGGSGLPPAATRQARARAQCTRAPDPRTARGGLCCRKPPAGGGLLWQT